MKIEIQRNETSKPILYDAVNAYTKGPLNIIMASTGVGKSMLLRNMVNDEN